MTADEPLAFCVPEGWTRVVVLGSLSLRHATRLLFYDGEDRPRVEHRCERPNRGTIICAPSLHPDHVITETERGVTVRASITCPDCGLHGWITQGRWHDC